MRSLFIPPHLIAAASLSFLSACNNFSANLKTNQDTTNQLSGSSLPKLSLKTSLRSTYRLAQSDMRKLHSLPQGANLSSVYWKIISEDPWPVKVTCLNSILKSQFFSDASSQEKLRMLKILRPAFTADTALIFNECFASEKFQSALYSPDFKGGKMLDSLYLLATQPMQPELDLLRGSMITDLSRYASEIDALDQSNKNICGPVACLIALSNKAELVRLVAGLSSEQASVQLASGAVMQRYSSAVKDDSDIHISPALRLLASSILEHSNGRIYAYSSNLDINIIGPVVFSGMLPGWCLRAMNDLTGRQHVLLSGQDSSVCNMLKTLNNNGQYAVVLKISSALHWHWIVVRRVEGDWAYFQDPRGEPVYTADMYTHIRDTKDKAETVRQSDKADKKQKNQLNLDQFFSEQSWKNFSAYPYGLPQQATYKVSVKDLANCAKVIIVPASSIK